MNPDVTSGAAACSGEAGETGFDDRDQTIRRLELEKLEIQARLDVALHATRHDSLTGLPNRAGFVGELTGRIANGSVLLLMFSVLVFLVGLVSEQISALRSEGRG